MINALMFIVVVLIIVCIFIIYIIFKPHEYEYRVKLNPNLIILNQIYNRHIDIMQESIDIISKSNNIETKKSRIHIAVTTAESLLREFKDSEEALYLLQFFKKYRKSLYIKILDSELQKYVTRINALKTNKAKINNINKTIEKLSQYKDVDFIETKYVVEIIDKLNNYAYMLKNNLNIENQGQENQIEYPPEQHLNVVQKIQSNSNTRESEIDWPPSRETLQWAFKRREPAD